MYTKVLLPVDLNHDASWSRALESALMCCRASGASLHVVTVLPDFKLPLVASYFPAGFEHKVHEEAERHLQSFIAEHVPADVTVSHEVLGGGAVHERILAAAKGCKADLIVMAAYRPDVKDLLLGSNAYRVVHHAPCSVLVVRD